MKLYNIFRITESGKALKMIENVQGRGLAAVWNSSAGWLSNGRYLVAAADGSAARLYVLKR